MGEEVLHESFSDGKMSMNNVVRPRKIKIKMGNFNNDFPKSNVDIE